MVAHSACEFRLFFRGQQGEAAHFAQIALKVVAQADAGQTCTCNGRQRGFELYDIVVFVEIFGEGVFFDDFRVLSGYVKLRFEQFRPFVFLISLRAGDRIGVDDFLRM